MTTSYKLISLGLLMIFALVVGIVAGVLSYLGGVKVPLSVIAGAGAFGATISLGLAIWNTV